MDDRLKLQQFLEELLGSRQVYFQPPETVRMQYPAFVYSLSSVNAIWADNGPYALRKQYEVKFITRDPDPPVVDDMLSTRGFSFDRHYIADNLHHYVFDVYPTQIGDSNE